MNMRTTAAVRLLGGDREPVRLASTANLSLSGLLTVDGVVTAPGDRVLIKDQTDSTTNGIYTASEGTWRRAPDSGSSQVLRRAMKVAVQYGNTHAGDIWSLDTDRPDIGDDDIEYSLYLNTDIADDINAARETLVAEMDAIIAAGLAAGKATEAEARLGASNAGWMTPLRTAQLLSSHTVVNAREFGVLGDDSTDNQANLAAARAYCHTNGVTLGIGDGIYRHSGTNAWGYEKLKVHALGDKVVLKHTGTGNANTMDGIGIYPASQGAAGGVFGGPNRFFLEGNANTTNCLMVDNWHFGDIKIAGKNATNAILLCQNNGIVGASAVETTFDVVVSANLSGAFTTVPLYGINATSLAACIFNKMIVEGVGNVASSTTGVRIVTSNGNVFNAGTVESCLAGGIAISGERNLFNSVHCEVNGTQQDWIISANNSTFISCAGAATTSGQYLAGNYNNFIGCKFQSVNIQPGATENSFINCLFLTAFTDGGTRTSVINPDQIATPRAYQRGPLTVASTTAVGAGSADRVALLYSTTAGLGHYFGTGAPTFAAAQGSTYSRTDGSGGTSRMYINAGSTTWVAVNTAG